MSRRVNLFRCAYAQAIALGTGAQPSSQVALYNNSTGPDLLLVHMITCGILGSTSDSIVCAQGSIGGTPATVFPMVTDEAPIPGIVSSSLTQAIITEQFWLVNTGPGKTDYFAGGGLPARVLRPGWSLIVQDGNALVLSVSFLWEAVHTEDIRGQHCPICDVTIALK